MGQVAQIDLRSELTQKHSQKPDFADRDDRTKPNSRQKNKFLPSLS